MNEALAPGYEAAKRVVRAEIARGADVECPVFGNLTTDMPFAGKILDERLAKTLAGGFDVTGRGPAKVVAFYTPP